MRGNAWIIAYTSAVIEEGNQESESEKKYKNPESVKGL